MGPCAQLLGKRNRHRACRRSCIRQRTQAASDLTAPSLLLRVPRSHLSRWREDSWSLPCSRWCCEGCRQGRRLRVDGLLDSLGDHRSACATSGVLASRVLPREHAVARVCREAGARVAKHVRFADMNPDLPISDDRRIQVVANGTAPTSRSMPPSSRRLRGEAKPIRGPMCSRALQSRLPAPTPTPSSAGRAVAGW